MSDDIRKIVREEVKKANQPLLEAISELKLDIKTDISYTNKLCILFGNKVLSLDRNMQVILEKLKFKKKE